MNTDREYSEQQTKQSRWGFRGKTVWDFLQLLIVPLMLVAIGSVFSLQQDARQQRIEDQRAQAERELAEQRAQDEALQAYLNQMSQLMLDRKLLEAEQGTPLYTLAQARTSTAILRLDAAHNESVTRFLSDSGLAESSEASPRLLREIPLSHAKLSGAALPNADLSKATLIGADLSGADLSNASLPEASLSNAGLWKADLSFARLSNASLPNAGLGGANLSFAYLPNAGLSDADLSNANLYFAYLNDADLNDADLGGANLTDAKGWTTEQLTATRSLEGATMPDGQTLRGDKMPDGPTFEDWLKDKKARKEDGQNDGSS